MNKIKEGYKKKSYILSIKTLTQIEEIIQLTKMSPVGTIETAVAAF